MTDADRQAFAIRLHFLAEATGESLTAERIASYFHVLEDCALAAVTYAIEWHAKRAHFFPRAAELRETAKAYRLPGIRRLEDQHRAPADGPGHTAFQAAVARLRKRHGVSA